MSLHILLLLFLSLTTPLSAEKAIQCKDLLPGDIVFWADKTIPDRAGHVAIVTHTSTDLKKMRIAHSTDNPKYMSFVETYLPPSSQIAQKSKHYAVLRLKSLPKRKQFTVLIKKWLSLGIPFNTDHEKKMNAWDDAMPTISSATKAKLQYIIFQESKGISEPPPPDGFMCSEIVIEALQRTFAPAIPASLRLDPILCPPSTMMISLFQDHQHFVSLGILIVPDFEFSPHEKELFEQNTAQKREGTKQKWQDYRTHTPK